MDGGDRVLGLKVDVDTRRGMEEGVPSLLSQLAGLGLRATFFLAFGPDNSGKALYRVVRNPRFLLKMVRTNAPGLYGFRTALYGTVLKAPMIAAAFPALCREIEARGHEVELHAWDHRAWQDTLPARGPEWIGDWLDRGLSAYRSCLGHPPRAFGAPGWLLTRPAVEEIGRRRWEYVSCTRASAPFVLSGTGLREVPSDLPCLEETGGRKGAEGIVDALSAGGTHVYPVHAEVEGGILREAFAAILRGALERGYRIVPLSEIVRQLDAASLPRRDFRTSLLRGRAFPCAV
ncbi:MAG TPA: polysaccharide deacetylase family protein [Candidatus Aquicultoraceae bacterium]|nr:polysaccharide deacetylase family protein [Candidatus Aquicultoraceae bacterium]